MAIKMATKWRKKKRKKITKRDDKMMIKMATIWRQNGDKIAIKMAKKR